MQALQQMENFFIIFWKFAGKAWTEIGKTEWKIMLKLWEGKRKHNQGYINPAEFFKEGYSPKMAVLSMKMIYWSHWSVKI
jgi:hypothetical protein